jgi:hypothetical protein
MPLFGDRIQANLEIRLKYSMVIPFFFLNFEMVDHSGLDLIRTIGKFHHLPQDNLH